MPFEGGDIRIDKNRLAVWEFVFSRMVVDGSTDNRVN
jgi:hypothetical protein